MKIRYLFVVISLFSTPFSHAGCNLISVIDNETTIKFRKYGGWVASNFEEVCEKINRVNARLLVSSGAAVLGNKSIGWAQLAVMDKNHQIMTNDYASINTTVNDYASQDKADELEILAINSALEEWRELDKALLALEKERQSVRKAFTK